jgi:hypothetical protein
MIETCRILGEVINNKMLNEPCFYFLLRQATLIKRLNNYSLLCFIYVKKENEL